MIWLLGSIYAIGFASTMVILLRYPWERRDDEDVGDFLEFGSKIIGMCIAWPIVLAVIGLMALGSCVRHKTLCPDCKGEGGDEGIGNRWVECATCKGTRMVIKRAYQL